jgi:hypothetical protein
MQQHFIHFFVLEILNSNLSFLKIVINPFKMNQIFATFAIFSLVESHKSIEDQAYSDMIDTS